MHASNTMGVILYLAPVPAAQIIHPNCDLKTLSTFHSSLWGNKHGDPRFVSQVFAKNSLIKNIFEEENRFDSTTWFFWGTVVSNLVYLGQGEDLKITTELSEKVQYLHNQAIKKELNEAILLIWIKEALCSR